MGSEMCIRDSKPLMHEDEKMRTGEPKMQGKMPNKKKTAKLARLQARVLCAAHEVLKLLCAVWPESDTSGVALAYGWSFPYSPPSVPHSSFPSRHSHVFPEPFLS